MDPVSDFPRPYPLQFRGSRLAGALLRLAGWRLAFDGLPALQGVLIVYPHTSNWDFVVMILAKWALGVPVRFWGKDRLFRVPLFGRWLRWVGGVPVDRASPRGVTGQAVALLARRRSEGRYFWLGLAPEGTRKYIDGLRSGFYRTAQGAGVPLGLVRLDYARREVRVLDFIVPSGDADADLRRLAGVYAGVVGRVPANASPLRLLDASVPRADTMVK
ncbi:MAG: 1-acyl-sn-glycerol-3-phosphate acyltransferase [Ramlibacter sp.]|nr:1-acyl-sn-glycerol-3-phosphate acyltransferase [Ramlibacter sp.]